MPDVWRIYRIKNCRHTIPHKDKFAIIVCKDIEYMGFLINSKIHPYLIKRPYLYECQILLSKEDYRFLFHDSFLDCTKIYPFKNDELVTGLGIINDKTKTEIKSIVAQAKTIEKRYISLLLNS